MTSSTADGVRAAVALLCALAAAFAWAALRRPENPRPAPDLASVLCDTTWAAYAPTNFDPNAVPPRLPSDASIRADLRVLRRAGFDGLITYGADVPGVPALAEEAGFARLILGVWNPDNAAELQSVVRAARSERVVGLIVGNEGLMARRYDITTLREAMGRIRRETGKPVSSTEVIEAFFTNHHLVEASDFLTVNAHPYFRSLRDPEEAAAWTIAAYDNLAARRPDRPVILKEVGLPTRGDAGLSEARQARYYARLAASHLPFAYFEAFDTLFKPGAVEQSWGLFRADRTPKPAASVAGSRAPRRCRTQAG